MPSKPFALVVVAAGLLLCPDLAVAQSLPAMNPDAPVQCYNDAADTQWRVQCDPETKLCLYAPNAELDAAGHPTRPLERTRTCQQVVHELFDLAAFAARGHEMLRATADAPHGWRRDERGRIFQVSFDLHRRMYLGGGYAPTSGASSRAAVDFGLLVFDHYGGNDHPTRHRLRLAQGEVFLAPFSGRIVLAHYDLSRRFQNPLVRITTFFGTPRRSDLKMNLGLWLQAGDVEIHEIDSANFSLWKFVAAQGTLDLWQSRRLESFARVRGGVGIEGSYHHGSMQHGAVTPGGALEAIATLDDNGFHHLGAELTYELPIYYNDGGHAERLAARAHYEVVFLAINDQPLSLRLAAGADKRSDLPGTDADWAFRADAGLRFSLWAPPRVP